MLLIYTPRLTPRIRYTFNLVFKDILGIDYSLTQDADVFAFTQEAKLSYSEKPISDELFFYSTKLLFEKGVHEQEISVFEWNDTKGFFATHPKYIFPFDPFAAIFYLTTRYEEYLPHNRDVLDRYDAKESLAWQKGFLQKPVVNIWAKKIKEAMLNRYPDFSFPKKSYEYISTIDIDNAFAYKEKGIVRTTGALVRSLFRFELKELGERIAVLLGKGIDPYDTYALLDQIQKGYNLKCIYFFLLGDYAENDKNVPISSKILQSLIKSIADYSDCGIHPSFLSNSIPEKIGIEKSRLRKVLKRDVTKSRQHFLMLKFPSTYRNLIENDITDDYSMGYSNDVGFRAGTCTPFNFYDLELEEETKLKVHPFAIMDATLKYYLKVKPENAMSYIEPLIKEIKNVEGTFISLWHNESLSDRKPWEGWRNLYEQMVKVAAT